MTAPYDPFEVIRRLRPPPADQAELQPGEDAHADALLERIIEQYDASIGHRWRWRRRLLGGGLAVVLAAGASVAAARWLAGGEPTVIGLISCWSDDTPPPRIQVGLDHRLDQSPQEQCRVQWSNGELSHDGPPSELTGCITSDGIIAVVPTDEAGCARLGFAIWAPTPAGNSALEDYHELTRRLNQVLTSSCFDESETRSLVADVLADDRFTDWTVTDGQPFTAQLRCGLTMVDAATKVVTLIGTDPPPQADRPEPVPSTPSTQEGEDSWTRS